MGDGVKSMWCSPEGVVQGTAWLRYVLETVHDMIGGDSVCDGDSFAVFQPPPHARPFLEYAQPTSLKPRMVAVNLGSISDQIQVHCQMR